MVFYLHSNSQLLVGLTLTPCLRSSAKDGCIAQRDAFFRHNFNNNAMFVPTDMLRNRNKLTAEILYTSMYSHK